MSQEGDMTPAARAVAAAINALLDRGFVRDGATTEQVVRIPTRRSPVYGGIGGELAKFGGRQRFALGQSNVKATVGPRTVAIYSVEGPGLDGVRGIASVPTKELAQLHEVLGGLIGGEAKA